jgi:hypothetical protein
MWEEAISEWKTHFEENPPSWRKPSQKALETYVALLAEGVVFLGDKSSERFSATTPMDLLSDLRWLYANYLACEYDPICIFPVYDVLVPLNPLMAPPSSSSLKRSGRRACRRHALNMIDPLHHYMNEQGEM